MLQLNQPVALVTGGSKGIGAAIAKELAAAGAMVAVNYATDQTGAAFVAKEIAEAGGRAVAIRGDVSKSADVRRLFAQVADAFGSLDIVVNNAGVYQPMKLEEITEVEFNREFNTNVLGPFDGDPRIAWLLRFKRRQHNQRRLGCIANVSAWLFDLRSQQECPGCGNEGTRQRISPSQDPG